MTGGEAWRDRAACVGHDLSLFVGDERRGRIEAEAATADALEICSACPVAVECLAYGLAEQRRHGSTMLGFVYGGRTPHQIKDIANQERRAHRSALERHRRAALRATGKAS